MRPCSCDLTPLQSSMTPLLYMQLIPSFSLMRFPSFASIKASVSSMQFFLRNFLSPLDILLSTSAAADAKASAVFSNLWNAFSFTICGKILPQDFEYRGCEPPASTSFDPHLLGLVKSLKVFRQVLTNQLEDFQLESPSTCIVCSSLWGITDSLALPQTLLSPADKA